MENFFNILFLFIVSLIQIIKKGKVKILVFAICIANLMIGTVPRVTQREKRDSVTVSRKEEVH